MNRLILILFTLVIFLLSCTGQDIKKDNISLEVIIEDSLYIKLREQNKISIKNHLKRIYDFKKIDKVFERNNVYSNSCDWDLGELKNDVGVKAYFEIDCKIVTLINQLKTKYSFLNEPNNTYFVEMGNLYKKKHGIPVNAAEVIDILKNN
jgi:hypothetical protein